MFKINKQQGLIRTIVLVVVAILVLSYFGIDLQKAVESQQSQKNIGYVKAVVITVWERYLKGPAEFLWNVFVNLIWQPVIHNLETKTLSPASTTPQLNQ